MRQSVLRHLEPHPCFCLPPNPSGLTRRVFLFAVQATRQGNDTRARAIGGAEQSRKPFLESPANFVTRAPNSMKLGQAGRARQDLV